MFHLFHILIVATYIVLPVIMLARVRRQARAKWNQFWMTCFFGLMMGVVVCAVSAVAQHGRVIFSQVLLATYFATSLLLILKGFDALLWIVARKALRLSSAKGSMYWYGTRATAALLLRAVVLFAVGLPYLLAAAMTYRPHVTSQGNPQLLFNWRYETVSFPATDGTKLAGWWIPAARGVSSKTVLLCHGMAGSKATQLSLAKRLVPGGYNILAFDFRAHGDSSGQITTFGDLERRDVLGAIRWLRSNHPEACQRVVGLGASTGAAALIAAAVDPSGEGRYIDALAVYGSFDRLDSVLDSTIDRYIPPPMSWCVKHIGLPLASLQVGTNLGNFSPAEAARSLWPRPILVVHGLEDEMIDFERGEALYDAAFQPKYNDWIDRGGHEDILSNDAAARYVKRYFDLAGSWL